MYKSEYIAELQLICSSSGSYVAKIRRGKINDVLNLLRSKAKITYNLDNRLIRMSYENYTLTYIYPDRLILKLGSGKTRKDVIKLLESLLEK